MADDPRASVGGKGRQARSADGLTVRSAELLFPQGRVWKFLLLQRLNTITGKHMEGIAAGKQ